MLCNLLRRGGVDDPQLWPDNDVRDSWVGLGVPVAQVHEKVAVDEVLDLEFVGVGFKALDGFVEGGLVFEEEEGDVVCGGPVDGDARGGDDERGVDIAVEGWVNGGLAMF